MSQICSLIAKLLCAVDAESESRNDGGLEHPERYRRPEDVGDSDGHDVLRYRYQHVGVGEHVDGTHFGGRRGLGDGIGDEPYGPF